MHEIIEKISLRICVAMLLLGVLLAFAWGQTATPERQQPWTLRLGGDVSSLPAHVESFDFAPTGEFLACVGENRTRLVDTDGGKSLAEVDLPNGTTWTNGAITISRDGNLAAVTGHGTREQARTGRLVVIRLEDEAVLLEQEFPPKEGYWEEQVTTTAFSPDGTRLLAGTITGDVIVWKLATAERVFETVATDVDPQEARFRSFPHDVAFSPDGTLIASAGLDQITRVWNSDDPSEPAFELETGRALSLTFVPHEANRIIVRARGRNAREEPIEATNVWDVESGEIARTIGRDDPLGRGPAEISADGRLLAVADMERIRIYDFASGKRLVDLSDSENSSFAQYAHTLAFSPDGKQLASRGVNWDSRLWDTSTGARLFHDPNQHESFLRCTEVSLDGKTVLTASSQMIRLWDGQSGRPLRTIHLPMEGYDRRSIMQASFTPDGESIVLCGGATKSGPHPIGAPESESVIGVVEVWNVRTGQLRTRFLDLPWYATSVCFGNDGKLAAVYCGMGSSERSMVFTFSLENWGMQARLESGGENAPVYCLRFGEATHLVETFHGTNGISAWDLRTSERTPPRHSGALQTGVGVQMISGSGEWLLAGDSETKGFQLVDGNTLEAVHGFDTAGRVVNWYPKFSPGNTWVAGHLVPGNEDDPVDDIIRVWDIETGEVVKDIRGLPSNVASLAFFPGGKRLVCAMYDRTAVVIEID